eukprot:TRINITY_DN7280_c0_g1_i1.p1 TRINITY_DN7280_c0_g1~~TRINITY_DN7280_c0_g1_i1.p1  ORF type:complete len:699 (+),score=134.04 TRINITY_DN7280_c0_g1_i1:100-2196(+)
MSVEHARGFTVGRYVCKGGRESMLGHGSFANVYRAEDSADGRVVAVKVVDVERLTRGNQKLKHHLASEIQIMKDLAHENIVSLFDVFVMSESYIYMVFEYCNGGDLAKYLQKHRRVPEAETQFLIRQLASGLQFLRSKNIIHRDLKPQNLLLHIPTPGGPICLKIADFGFARFIDPQSVADTLCGSPLYMAPEILRLQSYSVKSDLWSVGAILFEMLSGAPPFPVKNHVDLLRMIDKKFKLTIPPDLHLSKSCLDLLQSLLKQDPLQRMSWEEFFMHPFLKLYEPRTPTPSSLSTSDLRAGMASSASSAIAIQPRVEVDTHSNGFLRDRAWTTPARVGSSFQPTIISPPVQSPPIGIPASLPSHYRAISRPAQAFEAPIVPRASSFSSSPPFQSLVPAKPIPLQRRDSASSYGSSPDTPRSRSHSQSSSGRKPSPGSSGSLSASPTPFQSGGVYTSRPSASVTTSSSRTADSKIDDLNEFEDDYIVIHSDSTPPLSTGTVAAPLSVSSSADFEAKAKRVMMIFGVGDLKVENNLLPEAVVLYVKALATLLTLLQDSKALVRSQSLTQSLHFDNILRPYRILFEQYLRKMDATRAQADPRAMVPSAEKLIYDFAFYLGREGAYHELLKNFQKSEQLYENGLLLLEQLLADAIQPSDRLALQNYVTNFRRRLMVARDGLSAQKAADLLPQKAGLSSSQKP